MHDILEINKSYIYKLTEDFWDWQFWHFPDAVFNCSGYSWGVEQDDLRDWWWLDKAGFEDATGGVAVLVDRGRLEVTWDEEAWDEGAWEEWEWEGWVRDEWAWEDVDGCDVELEVIGAWESRVLDESTGELPATEHRWFASEGLELEEDPSDWFCWEDLLTWGVISSLVDLLSLSFR